MREVMRTSRWSSKMAGPWKLTTIRTISREDDLRARWQLDWLNLVARVWNIVAMRRLIQISRHSAIRTMIRMPSSIRCGRGLGEPSRLGCLVVTASIFVIRAFHAAAVTV